MGGYSKLLKQAILWVRQQGCHTIVSYCNRDLSPDPNNKFYAKYGFSFRGDNLIQWYYSIKAQGVKKGFYYRQQLQKHKLKHLPSYSDDKTEQQILQEIGVYPVYNSGNFKYILSV